MNSDLTLLSFYSDYSSPHQCATRCDPRIQSNTHDRFLTFIAVCNKLDILILKSAWQAGLPTLGSGGTSTVSQGTGLGASTSYAFKRLLTPAFESSKGMQDFRNLALYALTCEMSILSNPTTKAHPNIIELQGVSFEVVEAYEGKICVWPVLIFPKADWFTVEEFIRRCELGGGLDMEFRITILLQVWAAVAYMHGTLAIMHGDIKPSNVLVFHEDENLVVKLIDFGYSSMFAEGLESTINVPMSTPWYAPELRSHSGSFGIQEGKSTDIFSLGLFALWIIFGDNWQDSPDETAIEGSFVDNNRWIQDIEELKYRDGLVQVARELLAQSQEVEDRYKGWMRSFFEKALPCDVTERASSVIELCSDLKGNEEFRLFPSIVSNEGEEVELVPDDEDYPRMNPTTEEEKVARENWGQCVQLDVIFLFEEFSKVDYRVRKHLIECLEFQADQESCTSCQEQAAFILAVFYSIGFGCPRDMEKSQRYLVRSSKHRLDMSEVLRKIKAGEQDATELDPEYLNFLALEIPLQNVDADYLLSGKASMVYKELHTELEALELSLGQDHSMVLDMRWSILHIQELRGHWDEVETLAQNLIAALSGAPEKSEQQTILWYVESTYANCLSQKGLIKPAEEIFWRIYNHSRSIFGTDHQLVLHFLRDLCAFWNATGEFRKVENELEDLTLFQIDSDDQKPTNMRYAKLALQLGASYRQQGRYDDAERMIVPAVEFVKGVYGDSHPETLIVSEHLINLHLRMHHLEDAERMVLHLRETLNIMAFKAGETAHYYPQCLLLLAQVYSAQDRLEEALDTIREAIVVWHQFFAVEIYSELGFLDVEAVILLRLKRWDEGVDRCRKVAALSQNLLGNHHRDSRDRIVGLAAAYSMSGDLDSADRTLTALLNELTQDSTASKFNLMACTEHLADLRRRQDRLEEAVHFAGLALDCAKNLQGKEEVSVTYYMGQLAELYSEAKSYEQALAIRIQILDIIETESKGDFEQVIDAMEDVSIAYFHLRDFQNAESHYRNALEACKTELGIKHEMYVRLLEGLASTIEEDPNRINEVAEIEEEIDSLEDDSMSDVVLDSSEV